MSQVAEFTVTGQLIGFVIKDGYKLKYLRVAIAHQEYWFKPAKHVCGELSLTLTPNCWLEISGEQKICKKTGKLKLKANDVKAIAAPTTAIAETEEILSTPTPAIKTQAKACILVCKKSSCWQRGGEEICHQLAKSLDQRGLQEEVQIKTTGCLKQCKRGPNLVVMPDKTRYSYVKPQEVISLLDQHFPKPVIHPQGPTMASGGELTFTSGGR